MSFKRVGGALPPTILSSLPPTNSLPPARDSNYPGKHDPSCHKYMPAGEGPLEDKGYGTDQFAILRWWDFHIANPYVYCRLRDMAVALAKRGRKKIGIKTLWEVMRWEHWMETDEEPRLNNDYTSRYARLLMDNEPELRDMFEVRKLA